jgi:nucleoside-diphosphate-sugar epimerase
MVKEYSAENRARGIVIRPFNVYGPGQRDDFVVSRFVGQALRGEQITVAGDGTQIRTFTYIDDFVSGTVSAIERAPAGTATYNICGAEMTSIENIAALIQDSAGSGSVAVGVGLDDLGREAASEVRHRLGSFSAARRELGYVPRVGLREGIAQVVSSYRAAVPAVPAVR